MKYMNVWKKYLRTHIFKNFWTWEKALRGVDSHKSNW